MPAPRVRSTTSIVSLLLAVAMTLGMAVSPAMAAPVTEGTRRLAGPERVATAVAVARAGWDTASDVVLARADDPADALAGSVLAAALDAPLLITPRDSLAPAVRSELARLETRTVHVLGGAAAVGEDVTATVRALGMEVRRIAGATRFETAAAIAAAVAPAPGGTVVLVGTWQDALAVAGYAARATASGSDVPILLSGPRLDPAARSAISRYAPAEVVVVGGSGAMPAALLAELGTLVAQVTRVAGSSRYATSAAVAALDRDRSGDGPALVATGERFPDGLAAGAYAARTGAILQLVPTDTAALGDVTLVGDATHLTVVGGEGAVTTGTIETLKRMQPVRPGVKTSQPGAALEGPDSGSDGASSDGATVGNAPLPARSALPTPADADIVVDVGDDLAGVVAAAPAGSHIFIRAGVHRLTAPVRPKDGMRFTGEPGAVLSGGRVLPDAVWTRDGSGRWSAGGQTQEAPTSGVYGSGSWQSLEWALPGHEQAVFRGEELFVDGRRLRHVNALAEVDAADEWYFDAAADRITVGADPRGHRVETSVIAMAFQGDGTADVVIDNLEIRHFASAGNRGAIDGHGSRDWVVRHVWVHHNHAGGVRAGPGMRLEYVRATDNGQVGIGGNGGRDASAPIVVDSSELSRNGVVGFDPAWGAGGLKLALTRGAIVQNTLVRDNLGKGIWFDIDCADTTIRWNHVEGNSESGIFYEISFDATIRENVVVDNGWSSADVWPAVYVVDSADVEVDHNLVHGSPSGILAANQNREHYELGPTGVRGLAVHHNVVGATDRSNGMSNAGSATSDVWSVQQGNRFDANTYRMTNFRSWTGTAMVDFAGWQGLGMDAGGQLVDADSIGAFPGATRFVAAAYGPRS